LARGLAASGAEVTLVARGAHLAALRRDGLTLIERDGSARQHRLAVLERAADAGPQDLLVLAMKRTRSSRSCPTWPACCMTRPSCCPCRTGIPWWYFQHHGGPHEGRRVEPWIRAHDRRGHRARAHRWLRRLSRVRARRARVIRHVEGERFPLGELDAR